MDVVSIIVPVYNICEYLPKCLNSLISQTYNDIEILLIDDGSTDSSSELCDMYSKKYKNITVVHKKNGGVSSARNKGLDITKGKYVVFVDGDDYVSTDYIEKLYMAYEKRSIELSICNFNIDEKKQVKIKEQKLNRKDVLSGLYTPGNILGYLFNKMFCLDIIHKNSICFDEKAALCEDSLFCTQYVQHVKTAYFLDYDLYNYVIRESSATHIKYNEKKFSILDTYKKIIDLNRDQDGNIKEQLMINYINHCLSLFDMLFKNKKINHLKMHYIHNELIDKKKYLHSKKMPIKSKIKMLFYLSTV